LHICTHTHTCMRSKVCNLKLLSAVHLIAAWNLACMIHCVRTGSYAHSLHSLHSQPLRVLMPLRLCYCQINLTRCAQRETKIQKPRCIHAHTYTHTHTHTCMRSKVCKLLSAVHLIAAWNLACMIHCVRTGSNAHSLHSPHSLPLRVLMPGCATVR
jgi:hypothetical protein